MVGKKLKTIFVLLVLTGVISSVTPHVGNGFVYTAYAAENNSGNIDEFKALDEASESLYEALLLLNYYYMGGDVTLQQFYDAAMKGISKELDPYSEYMTDDEYNSFYGSLTNTTYGIGAYLSAGDDGYTVITDVMDGMPAKKAGIMAGDKIKEVDGVSVKDLPSDSVRAKIVSDKSGTLKLRLIRTDTDGESKEIDFTIKRAKIENTSVRALTLPQLAEQSGVEIPAGLKADSVGYIAVSSVNNDTAEAFEKEVKSFLNMGVDKLILDLRDNGGGFLDQAVALCNIIVPEGAVVHMVDKQGDKTTEYSTLKKCPFTKIAVLVNENTASAAEIIASALQDSKAGIIIGQTTFGKGIVQSTFKLTYGGIIKLTTEEYFSRDNKKINTIGVIPNIKVSENTDGKIDLHVKNALEYLKRQ